MITVKTNVRQVIIRLNGRISSFLPGAENYNGLLRTVATTMRGVILTRIHEQGKASDGSNIGRYSTKPMYANPNNLPGKTFKPMGKNETDGRKKVEGKTRAMRTMTVNVRTRREESVRIKKDFTERRTRYFAGGYNELKTVIGRNQLNGNVNLALSGQMQNQLNVEATSSGFGLGWPNAELLQRSDKLERKYGKKIWAPTKEELDIIVDTAQNYVVSALSE